MQIDPVNYEHLRPHVDHLIVTRVAPARSVREGVHITRVLEEGVDHPAAPEGGSSPYDVVIDWRGQVYRVHGLTDGGDDALHAILTATDRLDRVYMRRQSATVATTEGSP